MATREAIQALLERRGWVRVGASNINHLINHQNRQAASIAITEFNLKPRMGGWIRPPQMRLHTMEEAYREEGFGHADL
jgi:hypothetical protein